MCDTTLNIIQSRIVTERMVHIMKYIYVNISTTCSHGKGKFLYIYSKLLQNFMDMWKKTHILVEKRRFGSRNETFYGTIYRYMNQHRNHVIRPI